jgi:hypothetical protein
MWGFSLISKDRVVLEIDHPPERMLATNGAL